MVCSISLDWTYKGMKTLIMENNLIRIVSLIDKGSDIIQIIHKPTNIDLMWHSPAGYRNPREIIPTCPASTGSFLDSYGGGWQDILPSAGGPSKNRGAEWGIHGETALIPWDCAITRDDKDEVEAYLSVKTYRYPLKVEKRITLREGESKIRLWEKVTNMCGQELEFSWLQHPAFGEPFIAPGCRVYIPARTVVVRSEEEWPLGRLKSGRYAWPLAKDRNGREVDLSVIPEKSLVASECPFITDLDEGWYALINPSLKLGFGLSWDKKIYSWVWFWQNFNTPDHPWYGEAWNVALEPCTSYPGGLAEQIKEGTAAKIGRRESVETTLIASVFEG
ncbi:MAG: DUF4432 family protein, partial [Candidatus Bathyarchaeia archaeon]